jgi:hypothetical protein
MAFTLEPIGSLATPEVIEAAVLSTAANAATAEAAVALIEPGVPGGVATLDVDGAIPESQVPARLSIGSVEPAGLSTETLASLSNTIATAVEGKADAATVYTKSETTDLIDNALEGVSVDVIGSTIVYHGTTATAPRPVTDNAVIWVGSVYPLNAVLGDLVPDVEIPAEPAEVYFSDDYNRANGAPGPTPVGALTGTMSGTATAAIISNALAFTGITGTAYWFYETGHADGVFRAKVGAVPVGANGVSVVFRYGSATNHLMLVRVASATPNWRLIKRVGSATAVDVFVSSVPIAANDTFVITMNGTAIDIHLNGALFWAGTVADLVTNTKHGVSFNAAAEGGLITYDDLSLTALA